jgi:hypothetical protein
MISGMTSGHQTDHADSLFKKALLVRGQDDQKQNILGALHVIITNFYVSQIN